VERLFTGRSKTEFAWSYRRKATLKKEGHRGGARWGWLGNRPGDGGKKVGVWEAYGRRGFVIEKNNRGALEKPLTELANRRSMGWKASGLNASAKPRSKKGGFKVEPKIRGKKKKEIHKNREEKTHNRKATKKTQQK